METSHKKMETNGKELVDLITKIYKRWSPDIQQAGIITVAMLAVALTLPLNPIL